MGFFNLFMNESKFFYYELKQYWFEAITSTIFICAMFVALFYGVKSFALDDSSAQTATSLNGLLFGFLLWTFATGAYSSVTKIIIENNHKGTLEQLFMCPNGFVTIMLARACVEMVFQVILLTVMAILTMWLTGNWIDLNFAYFYLLLFIAAPALIGVSFAVAGLALVFKRVESIGAMLNIAFMGLVALDALPFNLWSLLPFASGASLTRDVILEGQAINILHLGIVIANSLVYLTIGIAIYKVMEKRAKRKNLLCQY